MNGNGVTVSRDGSIALAHYARVVASEIIALAAVDGIRLYLSPQADGTCLIVNTPKYENIWAFNRAPRTKKARTKK